MANIFEDPTVSEANNRAADLITRMRNVVEELHSRHGDGFNRFGTEETGVVRLLLIVDEMLNSETYDGNGFAFIQTAVSTAADEETNKQKKEMLQAALNQVIERRVPSELDKSRSWIVFSLCQPDVLSASLEAMWKVGDDVLSCFYKRSSPIYANRVPFQTEMVRLLKRLHHPHGGELLELSLDIGALSSFHTLLRSQLLASSSSASSAAVASSSSIGHHDKAAAAAAAGSASGGEGFLSSSTASLPLGANSVASAGSQDDHTQFGSLGADGRRPSFGGGNNNINNNNNAAAGAFAAQGGVGGTTPLAPGGKKKIIKKVVRRVAAGGAVGGGGGGGGGVGSSAGGGGDDDDYSTAPASPAPAFSDVAPTSGHVRGGAAAESHGALDALVMREHMDNAPPSNSSPLFSPASAVESAAKQHQQQQQSHSHAMEFGSAAAVVAPSAVPKKVVKISTHHSKVDSHDAQVQAAPRLDSVAVQTDSGMMMSGAGGGGIGGGFGAGGGNSDRTLEELAELDHALTEREAGIRQREEQLEQQQQELAKQRRDAAETQGDLDTKLDATTNVANTLKKMYLDLFNVSRNYEDSGNVADLRKDELNPLLQKIVAVLAGQKDLGAFISTPAKATAAATTKPSTAYRFNDPATSTPPPASSSSSSSSSRPAGFASSSHDNNNNNNNNNKPNSQDKLPSQHDSEVALAGPLRRGLFASSDYLDEEKNHQEAAVGSSTSNGGNNTNNNSSSSSSSKGKSSSSTAEAERRRQQELIEAEEGRKKQQEQMRLAREKKVEEEKQQLQVNNTSFTTRARANTTVVSNPNGARSLDDSLSNLSFTSNNNNSSNQLTSKSIAALNNNNSFTAGSLNSGSASASTAAAAASASASSSPLLNAKPKISAVTGKPLVVLAPDTCPSRPSAGIPYIIAAFDEPDRNTQLQRQRSRCPKCQCELSRNDQSNTLLRGIMNLGQLALQQKPRRCHYSAEIFCQKCHTNKTALIPHKVCTSWDFEEYHVSDSWYDYLQNNFERPIIHLPDVDVVARKPVAQQLAMFRRKLNRMHAILVLCPAIQQAAKAKSIFVTSYYFSREHWWSLADLVRMRLLEPDAPSNLARGLPNSDLLQHLGRLMSEALDHINGCGGCRERGYGVCTLCTEVGDERTSFWEDGTACANCASIFHESCYDIKGCPRCKAAAEKQ